MKKILSALLVPLALAGCGWDMDVGAWRVAELACKDHGGVIASDFYQHTTGAVVARCADGTRWYVRAGSSQ